MTRNSDLYLKDIIQCNHTPKTPIVDDNGKILYWICRCGRQIPTTEIQPIPQNKE
jgi:hypothetical protein